MSSVHIPKYLKISNSPVPILLLNCLTKTLDCRSNTGKNVSKILWLNVGLINFLCLRHIDTEKFVFQNAMILFDLITHHVTTWC